VAAHGARPVIAATLLALVIGATLLSFWVATQNFRIADPTKTPRTAEVLNMAKIEGSESRVMFSRYFASESNRAMFWFVGAAQVAGCLGAWLAVSGAARRGWRHGRKISVATAAAALLSVVLAPMVPWMVAAGRKIDFVSRAGGDPPEVHSFKVGHGLYMAGDALMLLAAVAALILLLASAAARPEERSP
jgi:hypothetical protein